MINVTKTFLPPMEEYQAILQQAWDAGWITNRGQLVLELEGKLKDYLEVSNVIAMTNGTLPLQIAIKALGLQGEIITTPFSYVATTSSIVWEGCTPVFVDIHPEFLTIDETKIEAAITPKTSAILATHVFGNPCAVEEIDRIAKKHNLKVIYDGAHAFGVTYKAKSIFEYGDVTTCSFHATKLFHTGEGGALFFKDATMYERYFYHHNFGHKGNENFQGVGINGKMSEPQAALGLAILPYMDDIVSSRKQVCSYYHKYLDSIKSITIREECNWNYSYFPVVFDNENELELAMLRMKNENIFPRRYFHPSLNTLSYVSSARMAISEDISNRIMCLPLSHDLEDSTIRKICSCMKT